MFAANRSVLEATAHGKIKGRRLATSSFSDQTVLAMDERQANAVFAQGESVFGVVKSFFSWRASRSSSRRGG